MTIDNVTERNGENIGESHRLGANNRGTRGRVVMRWNCAVDDTVPLFLLLLLSHRRENVRSVKTVYSKATNNIGARKGDNREFDPKPRDYNQPSLSLSVKFSIRFDNSTRRVQRGRFDNYPLCSKTRLDSIRFDPPSPPSLRNRADPPMVHPSTYLANRFDPAPGGISIENGGNRFHFGFWKLRVIKGGRCSLPLFSCRWWQWHTAEAKVVGVSRRVKKWRGSWKLGPGTDDPGSGSGGGTAGVSVLSRVSFQDFFLIDPLFRKLFNFFVTGIVFFFCGF